MRPPAPPRNVGHGMIFFAALCIGLGVFPGPLYALLPFPVAFVPYTAAHVVTILQLLMFSGLAFFICLPMMKRTLTISLDADWAYRRLLPRLVRYLVATFSPVDKKLRNTFIGVINKAINGAYQYVGPKGVVARTLPAGAMVFWAVALLAGFLVAYLI